MEEKHEYIWKPSSKSNRNEKMKLPLYIKTSVVGDFLFWLYMLYYICMTDEFDSYYLIACTTSFVISSALIVAIQRKFAGPKNIFAWFVAICIVSFDALIILFVILPNLFSLMSWHPALTVIIMFVICAGIIAILVFTIRSKSAKENYAEANRLLTTLHACVDKMGDETTNFDNPTNFLAAASIYNQKWPDFEKAALNSHNKDMIEPLKNGSVTNQTDNLVRNYAEAASLYFVTTLNSIGYRRRIKDAIERQQTVFASCADWLGPETEAYCQAELDKAGRLLQQMESGLKYKIEYCDAMEGLDFENFCAEILEHNAFTNVSVTSGSSDQGIDILAEKSGIKYGIQCKCYSSSVGNKAVQEALAGRSYYGCHVGAVLTNQYFTQSAKELAERAGILLWDRDELQRLIDMANT